LAALSAAITQALTFGEAPSRHLARLASRSPPRPKPCMQAWTIGLPTVSRQLAIACSFESARACPQPPIVARNAIKTRAGATANEPDLSSPPEAEGSNDLGMKRLPINMTATNQTDFCQVCPKFSGLADQPDHGLGPKWTSPSSSAGWFQKTIGTEAALGRSGAIPGLRL